jgi:hypothetical protein
VMQSLADLQTKLLSFDVPIREVLDYVRCQQAANRAIDVGELDWQSSAEKALKVLATYDFVGIMDKFDESLMGVCYMFGFIPQDIVPNINKATGDGDSKYLSEGDVNHIRDYLVEDMALYETIRSRFSINVCSADVLSKLCSKSILTKITPPFELDLGRPFPGSGWYEPEKQGDSVVRWNGPSSRAILYLPLDRSTNCSIRIAVWKPQYVNDIDVIVDDFKLVPRSSTNGEITTMELDLPVITDRGAIPITRITLDCKRTSAPHERKDGDLRTLGVLLTAVSSV